MSENKTVTGTMLLSSMMLVKAYCQVSGGIYLHTTFVYRIRLIFRETGKSWFYEIFVVFNFADGYVGLVPRRTESNFRGYLISRMAIDSRNMRN